MLINQDAIASDFLRLPHPNLRKPEAVCEALASPGFGKYFTDHMVTIKWSTERGWHDHTVGPHQALHLSPTARVFSYGQAIFEALKAYRHSDDSIMAFRPQTNARRFRDSAARMMMPQLPEDVFVASLRELVTVDARWAPSGDEKSLFLRPFMFAVEEGLAVRPANEYLYVVIASPAEYYFAAGTKPLSVLVSRNYIRAAPGGTGAAKFAGNYAASLIAQVEAKERGCDQVIWLDAVERRWIEEMGGMNLFLVFGEGASATIATPRLSGALLPGVTRDSLIRLANDLGFTVQERQISIDEMKARAADGELTEVFACGTAAVVTPVGQVIDSDGDFTIADGDTGPITMKLRKALTDIQRGRANDRHGWMHRLG
jgi:branched-chain amino acid aminotransferase